MTTLYIDEAVDETPPEQAHRAAVYSAGIALEQEWVPGELAEVLQMLGLKSSPPVPIRKRSHGRKRP